MESTSLEVPATGNLTDRSTTPQSSARKGTTPRSSNPKTSLLAEKQRQALFCCAGLLERNVWVTKEMEGMLAEGGILTGLYATQYQSLHTTEEKMACILEAIDKRGGECFDKFVEILAICGHPLIANFLQEETTETTADDLEVIWDQLATWGHKLRTSDKEKLAVVINDKVKEETLKALVRENAFDKENVTDAKRKRIQQSWSFQRDMKQLEKRISDMKEEIANLEERLVAKDEELKSTRQELNHVLDTHDSRMQVVGKFNMANDSSLRRVEDHLADYKRFANFVTEQVKPFSHHAEKEKQKDNASLKSSRTMSRDDTDLDALKAQFDHRKQLEAGRRNLKAMIEHMAYLEDQRTKFVRLKEEVAYVIRQMLGNDSEKYALNYEIRSAYQNYLVFSEVTMEAYKGEIKLLMDFLYNKLSEEKMPPHLRKVHEDRMEERKAMETKISTLEVEVMRLKKVMSLRSNAPAAPVGPTSTATKGTQISMNPDNTVAMEAFSDEPSGHTGHGRLQHQQSISSLLNPAQIARGPVKPATVPQPFSFHETTRTKRAPGPPLYVQQQQQMYHQPTASVQLGLDVGGSPRGGVPQHNGNGGGYMSLKKRRPLDAATFPPEMGPIGGEIPFAYHMQRTNKDNRPHDRKDPRGDRLLKSTVVNFM